ncbi:hypothetical protein UACE39S_02890 [Ureibacillus acetophenoni]
MVRNGFSESSIGKSISSFSRAMKGNQDNTSGSSTAARVGAKALSFINDVKSIGFINTLDKIGLSHLKGSSSKELRTGLLEYFNESGNGFYDSIAQQSMSELMRELLQSAENEQDFDEILSSIKNEEFLREFIIKFIQNCFFANFAEKLLSLFEGLEKYDVAQQSVKTYIRNSIESEYPMEDVSNVDWTGPEGNKIIQEKCNKAYEILSIWSETLV